MGSHRSDTQTATMSGTSMACPHVAGAAALLLSEGTVTSPIEVASILKLRATTGSIKGIPMDTANLLLYVGATTSSTPTTTPSPTPAPTPTPTSTPTLSPTPRPCKARCLRNSKPWSKTCTWNSCAGCSPCQTPTPTPTSTPTSSPTPKPCKAQCLTNSKPWSKKCKWDKCAGCSECQVNSGKCKAWCATNTK